MKKFTRIFGAVCIIGLLIFVSTSCKKDKEDGEMIINVTIPGFETADDRAYINANFQFMWHQNDYIRVYNLANEVNADESTTAVHYKIGNTIGPIARFRGPSVGLKKAEGFRYFYPVEMVKGTDEEIHANLWNENRQVFQVSDHQQFEAYSIPNIHPYSRVDGQAMPMAVAVDKLSDNAILQQLFGTASFQMRVDPEYTGEVVVDSIKLVDNYHNITGEVSLKLHKFCFEDYVNAWDQFFNEYQGFTPEYQQNILDPLYDYWGYYADDNTTGKQITLNCTFIHDDNPGTPPMGTTVLANPYQSEFPFMLRPLALSEGFTLYVYLEGYENPIVLTDADFYRPNQHPLDYTWAVKYGTYKRYILCNTIDTYLYDY